MASRTRQASKRKISDVECEILDMSNPKNWTKCRLLEEIDKLGIKVPASLRVAALIQIYKDNKERQHGNSVLGGDNEAGDNATEENISDQTTSINRIEAAANHIMRTLTNGCEGKETDMNIAPRMPYSSTQSPLIPDSVFAVQRNVNAVVNPQHHYDMEKVMTTMRQPGVPAENFRNVEIVSPQLRSQIIAGKDINLALLLMPNTESTSEHRRIDFDGIEYAMKPGDPRLSKNLTLGEFIVAFAIYKNILCEVMPHRREELDQYERDVVGMANQFGGTRFYDYHKAFSAKAAALLHQRHIKVDWSIRDNSLFCTMFAGMKINTCGMCYSVNHASDFCPLLVNPHLKKMQQGNNGNFRHQHNGNSNGTKRPNFLQGTQFCINYNERACTRPACKFLHVCYECSGPHPKSKCNSKSSDRAENIAKLKEKKVQDKGENTNQ